MTGARLSSPELHPACIVYEIGKEPRANGKRHTATLQHCNTATLQHCNTATLQHCKRRTSNGQRRFDKSVSVSLCRSLSVFMNIVAISQVNIQHTRGAGSLEQCRCQWSLEFDDLAGSAKCRRRSQKVILFTSKSQRRFLGKHVWTSARECRATDDDIKA